MTIKISWTSAIQDVRASSRIKGLEKNSRPWIVLPNDAGMTLSLAYNLIDNTVGDEIENKFVANTLDYRLNDW